MHNRTIPRLSRGQKVGYFFLAGTVAVLVVVLYGFVQQPDHAAILNNCQNLCHISEWGDMGPTYDPTPTQWTEAASRAQNQRFVNAMLLGFGAFAVTFCTLYWNPFGGEEVARKAPARLPKDWQRVVMGDLKH